jgi:hypothetical protein
MAYDDGEDKEQQEQRPYELERRIKILIPGVPVAILPAASGRPAAKSGLHVTASMTRMWAGSS